MNWGDHEPSQFSGPPTWEGATLDVPLPESATLSDMCVNGPIVYEWLDSVQRSQVHLLQRHAPNKGAILSPWWAGTGVRQAYRMCERMGGWVVYAWLRAWLGVCETGLERMQRWREKKKFNI